MGDHQKRLTAPVPWGIAKKEYTFITKTAPGPHNSQALPIAVWLRDQMGYALTKKEVKKILNDSQVIINGRVCKDLRRGIGLFDIVTMPGINKHYLILRDHLGKIMAKEIPPEQAKTRLCKVKGKTILGSEKVQLNLRYGANLLGDPAVNASDSVVITLGNEKDPSQPRLQVVEHYPFAVDSYAMVIGGRHRGRVGRIMAIEKPPGSTPTKVVLEGAEGSGQFDTVERYVIVIGRSHEAAARWGVTE
jgi:small subunit ribosomal protein S4e